MNIVFAGTPSFTLPCLDALVQSKHYLMAIYTQPDRPAGRGQKLLPSPVKTWAKTHDIPVYQPLNFKHQTEIDELAALQPDIMVVIAYGLILPKSVLNIPRYGCINVHASLLPRWRGASPIQHAILHGDKKTGITIMQMDSGMDTGATLATVSCPVLPEETTGSLHDKLAQLAISPLLTVLDSIVAGHLHPIPQDVNLANYAPKIQKQDALIHWQHPADTIAAQIRAFHPWPIAHTHAGLHPLKIHQARVLEKTSSAAPGTIIDINKEGIQVATGQKILLIERLQFPGGKAISAADYQNANQEKLLINMVLL